MKPTGAFFFNDFPSSYIPDILEEVYLKQIYTPYVLGKKDLLIADVGANIGLTSYYFKDYAKELFAVEPAASHQETLREMIAYNKITNITICPYAISNQTRKEKFYHNPNTTAHSLSLIANAKDYEEVECLSFDEFMVRNKLSYLDILKMDSDGEEAKIFTSKGFKEYAPKVKVILGEYHDWCGVGKSQFAHILEDVGYQFNWLYNTKAACFTASRI